MNNHTKDSRTLHRNNRLSHHHNPFDKDIFIITLYYVKANSNLKPITSMIEIIVTKGECTLPQSVLNDYNGNYICISQPNVVGTTPCVRYNSLKAKYATQKGSSDYSLTFDWNGSINIFVTIIKIK